MCFIKMKNLTLIIPAKREAESLPRVLQEVKNLDCEIIVILESSDIETIESISKPTWLPPQPFLNIGIHTRLFYSKRTNKMYIRRV